MLTNCPSDIVLLYIVVLIPVQKRQIPKRDQNDQFFLNYKTTNGPNRDLVHSNGNGEEKNVILEKTSALLFVNMTA